MVSLNYHHLRYFWTVAREGSIARASLVSGLSKPTISGQIHQLEADLEEKLFAREGRRLVLTEAGRLAFRYADEIFSLGLEFQRSLKGHETGRPIRLLVGVVETLSKLIVQRLLAPALELPEPVNLVCREGRPERLFALLAIHELDVVLSDVPAGPPVGVRAFSHLLGGSAVSFFGTTELAACHRHKFPKCLDGAPMLLPSKDSALRRALEQWFDTEEIRPRVVGEFDDSALLKAFGQRGAGFFPAPSVIESDVRRVYQVRMMGRVEALGERYYAVSAERKLKNPAVVAITTAARDNFFG